MSALDADPENVQGVTYAKRWLHRGSWSQLAENAPGPDVPRPPPGKIAMALHGGGIEPGTSEIALAVAGYHPAHLAAFDGGAQHDLWLFDGLMASGNHARLHVTASNYDDPIATYLAQSARRCISLHGCKDQHAAGKIQLGGLDHELRGAVLEELTAAGIPAEITTNPDLAGTHPDNVANKTTVGGCAQLELGESYRTSLFVINRRVDRKNTTNAAFWRLVAALRRALDRAP